MTTTIKKLDTYYQEVKKNKTWVLTYTQEAKLRGQLIPKYSQEIWSKK